VDWLNEPSADNAIVRTAGLTRWLNELHRDKPAEPPDSLRAEICQLGAHYLLNAKRGLWPFDPVARFHLANGARLERLNWLADRSRRGLRKSLGLMVNYEYRSDIDIERNRRRYAVHHDIIASRSVRGLAEQPLRSRWTRM
jgi:malonyl-CoA decarboxylase